MHVTTGSEYLPDSFHAPVQTKSKEKKKGKVVSYSDAVRQFIRPQPQEVLGGKLGMDLSAVAKALKVRFSDLKRNIERSDFFEMAKVLELKIVTVDTLNENGVLTKSYIMDEEAAEYLLVKNRSLLGYYYLRFLRQCRLALTVMTDEYEQLRSAYNSQSEQLQTANAKVEALTKPKKRKSGNKEVSIITNIVEKRDMFGDVYFYKEVEKKTINEMSPREHDLYKIQHGSKIVEGMTQGMKETMEKYKGEDYATKELADVAVKLKNVINRPDLPEEIVTGNSLVPEKIGR